MLDRSQRMQLRWYGHLPRMEDSRWPNRLTSGHRTVGEEEDHIIMEEQSDGFHEKQKV